MKTIHTSNRRFDLSDLRECIHYACGRNIIPGWLNVDGFEQSYPYGTIDPATVNQILQIDLTARHPFPSQCFRHGYAEDFLEHLTQAQSLLFLAECYRTFMPGGVLRLAFPGLAGVLSRHFRQSDFDGASLGVYEAFTSWHHEHFYNEQEIALVAGHLGFSEVRFCEYGQSTHPELANRETRPSQKDLNLYVELHR